MRKLDRNQKRMLTWRMRYGQWSSLSRVAWLFRVDRTSTVKQWIASGWLTVATRRIGGRFEQPRVLKRTTYRISNADVYRFVHNPETWPAWQVANIRDPLLRNIAARIRHNEPRYVTVEELAERYAVTPSGASHWIGAGLLPTVKAGKRKVVPESALADFVPPCQRKQVRIRQGTK